MPSLSPPSNPPRNRVSARLRVRGDVLRMEHVMERLRTSPVRGLAAVNHGCVKILGVRGALDGKGTGPLGANRRTPIAALALLRVCRQQQPAVGQQLDPLQTLLTQTNASAAEESYPVP